MKILNPDVWRDIRIKYKNKLNFHDYSTDIFGMIRRNEILLLASLGTNLLEVRYEIYVESLITQVRNKTNNKYENN